jgi:hypothetical protein
VLKLLTLESDLPDERILDDEASLLQFKDSEFEY